MFEYIFGIDKGVPIDIGLDFGEIIITRFFSQACFFGNHSFPCRSLLLSATILNDTIATYSTYIYIYIYIIIYIYVCISYNIAARGLPDIYARCPRASAYISGKSRARLCYNIYISLYLLCEKSKAPLVTVITVQTCFIRHSPSQYRVRFQ